VITILIADDHPIIRAGIRALLEHDPEMKVVGEAQDGDETRRLVAQLRPQVLLLDLRMPGMSAAELEKWVRTHYPPTITLVLTAHDRDAYLASMMDAGAAGFLEKNAPDSQLILAIRRAVRGEILFSNEQFNRVRKWREQEGAQWKSLTKREREVLSLLAQGLDNVNISQALHISVKTTAYHITHILQKLQATSRQEAIVWFNKNIPDDLENLPG
jgi:DNA-binding NarL/FixJ family response regulator